MAVKKIKTPKGTWKLETKPSPEIRWLFCGHCGHAVNGSQTVSMKLGWPKPVKVPKAVKHGR